MTCAVGGGRNVSRDRQIWRSGESEQAQVVLLEGGDEVGHHDAALSLEKAAAGFDLC